MHSGWETFHQMRKSKCRLSCEKQLIENDLPISLQLIYRKILEQLIYDKNYGTPALVRYYLLLIVFINQSMTVSGQEA